VTKKHKTSIGHRTTALILFCVVGIAACDGGNPAEVRDDTEAFPLVARWTATSAPVAPATVTGQLTYEQHLGYHSSVTFVVSGPPNGVFQWRIFKRDCSVNVAATGPLAFTGANGLSLFATTQSYPDVTLDATGKATVRSQIAGWLDSLAPYSVRIRPTATTTFTGVNPAACGDLKYAPAK
jgi:hypothetical protein